MADIGLLQKRINGLQQPSVLCVDPRPGSREVVTAALASTRARIEFADSGEEALQILSTAKNARKLPSLILLAWRAESWSTELLQAIKSDFDLRATPVVVLGQDITPEQTRVMYDVQANCVIEEPSVPEHRHQMLQSIGEFWLSMAELPGAESFRYLSSSK